MLDLSSRRPFMNAAYQPYERQAPSRCTLAVSTTSASVTVVRTNIPPCTLLLVTHCKHRRTLQDADVACQGHQHWHRWSWWCRPHAAQRLRRHETGNLGCGHQEAQERPANGPPCQYLLHALHAWHRSYSCQLLLGSLFPVAAYGLRSCASAQLQHAVSTGLRRV